MITNAEDKVSLPFNYDLNSTRVKAGLKHKVCRKQKFPLHIFFWGKMVKKKEFSPTSRILTV